MPSSKILTRLIVVAVLCLASGQRSLGHSSPAYSHDDDPDGFNTDWMANIGDCVRLNELSLPGTHDTMARFGGVYVQTQTWELAEQLNAGIRVIDIRARIAGDDVFAIHHGAFFQNAFFGEDVMAVANAFLDAHPTETVLMRLQEEYTPVSDVSFEEIFLSYMKTYGRRMWTHSGADYFPTLGEVRGKIVLLRSFGGAPTYGIGYGLLEKQDNFALDAPDSLYRKWSDVKDQLNDADNGPRSTMFINYLSGATDSEFPSGDIPFPVPVAPYFVASGHLSAGTDAARAPFVLSPPFGDGDFADFPRLNCVEVIPDHPVCTIFYEGTNVLTFNYINAGSVFFTGIIMADFPGTGLINRIVALNPIDRPPMVRANGPYVADEGSPIAFSGVGSHDPDGATLQYRWDFDSDGVWDTQASTDPVSSFTFGDDFDGIATLAATDGCQVRTATAPVSVANVPPTAAMTLANGAPFVLTNVPVPLVGRWTDPGLDTFAVNVAWSGAIPPATTIATAASPVADARTYSDAGDFPITLTVTDDDGGQGQVSAILHVRTPAGATQAIAEQLRPLAANSLVASAIASLIGNNDGRASNGALDHLAKGNVNAAFNPLERALADLTAAHGANPQLGLQNQLLLLTDVARSAAIQAITDAEKAGKKSSAAKIAAARALVAQGLALQTSGQLLLAVQKYELAQRTV